MTSYQHPPSIPLSQHPLENKREWMRQHINQNSIYRISSGEDYLDGKQEGTRYSWQFYLRRSLYDPDFISCLTDYFFYVLGAPIRHHEIQLAGMESAAVPMLTAFSLRAHKMGFELPVFSIRKEQKTYGLKNWFEGVPHPRRPVMIIDDLIAPSHYSFSTAVRILAEHKANVLNTCFCVVNKCRRDEIQPISFNGHEFKVTSPFTLDDFDLTEQEYRAGISNYKTLMERNLYGQETKED